jgi:hypothetical protein
MMMMAISPFGQVDDDDDNNINIVINILILPSSKVRDVFIQELGQFIHVKGIKHRPVICLNPKPTLNPP